MTYGLIAESIFKGVAFLVIFIWLPRSILKLLRHNHAKVTGE